MSAQLIGKLVLAGDIDLGEGELISGVVVEIPRDVLREVKTLPMYDRVEVVPAAEMDKLRTALQSLVDAVAARIVHGDKPAPIMDLWRANNAALEVLHPDCKDASAACVGINAEGGE